MLFSCNESKLVRVCLSMSTYWRRIGFMAHKVFVLERHHPWECNFQWCSGNQCLLLSHLGQPGEILIGHQHFLGHSFATKFTSAFDAAGGWEWSGRSSCRRDPFAQGNTCWLMIVGTSISSVLNLATWMSDAGIVFVSSASTISRSPIQLPPTKWEILHQESKENFRHQINRWCLLVCVFSKNRKVSQVFQILYQTYLECSSDFNNISSLLSHKLLVQTSLHQ